MKMNPKRGWTQKRSMGTSD